MHFSLLCLQGKLWTPNPTFLILIWGQSHQGQVRTGESHYCALTAHDPVYECAGSYVCTGQAIDSRLSFSSSHSVKCQCKTAQVKSRNVGISKLSETSATQLVCVHASRRLVSPLGHEHTNSKTQLHEHTNSKTQLQATFRSHRQHIRQAGGLKRQTIQHKTSFGYSTTLFPSGTYMTLIRSTREALLINL